MTRAALSKRLFVRRSKARLFAPFISTREENKERGGRRSRGRTSPRLREQIDDSRRRLDLDSTRLDRRIFRETALSRPLDSALLPVVSESDAFDLFPRRRK